MTTPPPPTPQLDATLRPPLPAAAPETPTATIGFSIVIPTYNRPDRLRKCLEAVTLLDYPVDLFEVIVVDDGGVENLAPICAAHTRGFPIVLLRQENAGPATARNLGASRARHSTLVFIDDDCAPAPDYLAALSRHFEQGPDRGIGGRTVGALKDDIYSMTSQMLVDYLFEYYNKEPDEAQFLTSNNLALPKQLFDDIGGFDTRFPIAAAEDRDLCDRWVQRGLPLCYVDDAVIHHSHAMNLRSFWRQHFNYGQGAASFHRGRAERDQGHVELEPFEFYSGLIRYPHHHDRTPRAYRMSALMFVSQAANALGFFTAVFKSWRQAPARGGND